ncbi:MAG: FecR family protein [Tannerella sp.]|nr:FecR family protein [Tannerella sp.]
MVYHTIEVPSGQRVKLVLADGSRVWLNAQKRFVYPAIFGKDARRVTLDGEGLFEVAPDARRPFTVQTNDITFAEMARRLEHYYRTQIIIRDSSVMNYRCTGKFRQNESITDIMDIVKSDIPFSYSYDRDLNKLTIRRREKNK